VIKHLRNMAARYHAADDWSAKSAILMRLK